MTSFIKRNLTVQPLGGAQFPMSYAMVGSVIPGVMRSYAVKTVNYQDLTSVIAHRKPAADPVKVYPHKMEDENTQGHPLMEKFKRMLSARGQPRMQPGFERIKEDLSWRGRSGETPAQTSGV